MSEPLFPRLVDPDDGEAIRLGAESLTYRELRDAAAGVAARLAGIRRAAVWAGPDLETCVAAAMQAGRTEEIVDELMEALRYDRVATGPIR